MYKILISIILLVTISFSFEDETPYSCRYLPNKFYSNCYSDVTNTAIIVSYDLNREDVDEDINHRLDFTTDNRVANPVEPSDYYKSGYDRGHLASDASFDSDEERLTEVYLMTNIVPMTPRVNRGVWKKLEDLERSMTDEYENTHIVNYVLYNGTKGGAVLPHNDTVYIPLAFVKEIHFKVLDNMFRKCYLVINSFTHRSSVKASQVRCGTYSDYVRTSVKWINKYNIMR